MKEMVYITNKKDIQAMVSEFPDYIFHRENESGQVEVKFVTRSVERMCVKWFNLQAK